MHILDQVKTIRFESIGLTEFAQAMPEKHKVPGDPVSAYRGFYVGEKLRFAKWKRRRAIWIEECSGQQSPAGDALKVATEE